MATAVKNDKNKKQGGGSRPKVVSGAQPGKKIQRTSDVASGAGRPSGDAPPPQASATADAAVSAVEKANESKPAAVREKADNLGRDAEMRAREKEKEKEKKEKDAGQPPSPNPSPSADWGERAREKARELADTAKAAVNGAAASSGADRAVTRSEAEKALIAGGVAPTADGADLVVPAGSVRNALIALATNAGVNDVDNVARMAEQVEAAIEAGKREVLTTFISECATALCYLAACESAQSGDAVGPRVISVVRPNGTTIKITRTVFHRVYERTLAANAVSVAMKHGFADEVADGVRNAVAQVDEFIELVWSSISDSVLRAFRAQGWK